MGYPMSYARVVGRNQLGGPGYTHTDPVTGAYAVGPDEVVRSMIRGDMRRLEQDSRDEQHLKMYAEHAGITVEQAKKLLDKFFEGTNGYPSL
jgi:hypothetical protein